jgi:hypothetical protein
MGSVSMLNFAPITGIRIQGAENAQGKLHKFRATTLARIREEAREAARDSEVAIRQTIQGAYHRGSTGETARTLRFTTQDSNNGIDVQFFLGGRAADYITTLGNNRKEIAGGGFPYSIIAKKGKAISFQPKGGGAFTVIQPSDRRRKPTIEFHLGRVAAAHVEHPGFPMGDVIRAVGLEEMQLFAERMTGVVAGAVAEITE